MCITLQLMALKTVILLSETCEMYGWSVFLVLHMEAHRGSKKNKINLLNTNIRDVVNSHKQTCENIRFNIDTLHKQFYRL